MKLKERIKPFLDRRGQLKVIYVATCSAKGEPNCAPRLIVDIMEPDQIFYVDFKTSQSHVNICRSKRASLAFMDERRLMSFKINGSCETLPLGKELEIVKAKWTKIVNRYHAERIIERITGVFSGRAREIFPTSDAVYVKFFAKEIKEVGALQLNAYPMEKITALQMHIDELEEDVKKHVAYEHEIETSRDFYKESSARFETAAMQDSLTGLYNQRGFLTLMEHHLKVTKRHKRNACFVTFDIDGLKQINDTLGHAKGNKALTDVAFILEKSFRESDIVARMGGDEFVVAMVDCELKRVQEIQGRFRENLAEHNKNSKEDYVLSLSVGTSFHKPDEPFDLSKLLVQSDRSMYVEKKSKLARES